jgi:HD superfamily phosphohydrolase
MTMMIVDPIYGRFPLSEPVKTLCMTPEVRRLSQIRLLNTLSPSLATLGEIRRYSHTLGVLFLAFRNEFLVGAKEQQAFVASVLLHDIGTPPFGHLLEYHLRERLSWDHESIIRRILTGSHVRENSAHQIFANQPLAFRSNLRKSHIDLDLVQAIISGAHPHSQLLFGTLDFDNLDNVARMNWALGQLTSADSLVRLATHLSVNDTGQLSLPIRMREDVREWLRLREAAYQVIVFDGPTVAAQAILSEALEIALDCDVIQQDDWVLTDEELIAILLKEKRTKQAVARQYLGRLPESIFVLQVRGSLQSLGFSSRRELTAALKEVLRDVAGSQTLAYVFVDRGTFTKRVDLYDPTTGDRWSEGQLSESVLLYAFTSSTRPVPHAKRMQAVEGTISRLKVSEASILRCEIGVKQNRSDAQQTFNIPA